MKQLTFEDYFPFHISVCQALAQKWGNSFYLKRRTWFKKEGKDEQFYQIIPGENQHYDQSGYLRVICDINDVMNEIKNERIVIISPSKLAMFKGLNFNFDMENEYVNEQYKDYVLKKGTPEQVTYFLTQALIYNHGLSLSDKVFNRSHENKLNELIKATQHHANHDEIIQEYLIAQKVKEYDQNVQIQIKKTIKQHFSQLWTDDIFNIMFLNGTKEEILAYWMVELKNQLYYDEDTMIQHSIHLYIECLSQHKNGLNIVIELLKQSDINKKYNESQVLVRDNLLKYFPNDVEQFNFLDLMQDEKKEIFEDIDINKVIMTKFKYENLQKKFKFREMKVWQYSHLMEAFLNILKNQKKNDIYHIKIEEYKDSKTDYRNLIIYLNNDSSLIRKDILGLLNDYYTIFISNLNIKEVIKIERDEMNDYLVNNHIEQWIDNYFLSLILNNQLEEKTTASQHKI